MENPSGMGKPGGFFQRVLTANTEASSIIF